MLFRRKSRLRITYTVANWPGADVTYSDWLLLPGIGRPRQAYHNLQGSASSMAWPQGSEAYAFPSGLGFGNQLLTDSFGDYGIRSWSITALPGKIPGKLTVASYHNDNLDDAVPDNIHDYDLGLDAWDSGPLPVMPSDGTVLWRYPLIRFVPINLLSLL